jgi:hypothetical protein
MYYTIPQPLTINNSVLYIYEFRVIPTVGLNSVNKLIFVTEKCCVSSRWELQRVNKSLTTIYTPNFPAFGRANKPLIANKNPALRFACCPKYLQLLPTGRTLTSTEMFDSNTRLIPRLVLPIYELFTYAANYNCISY